MEITQKSAAELHELHRNLLAEMDDRIAKSKAEIYAGYINALRVVAKSLSDAIRRETQEAVAKGTPQNEFSKPIDKNGCAI